MAALTTERDTGEISNGARTLVLPVKAKTVIYQGALVAIDTSGFAVPGKKAAGLRSAGRAEETACNALGADGEITVRVSRGIFIWENTSTTANRITAAHVLGPCYIEDDQTVTALAAGTSIAGLVIAVRDGEIAVEINPALTAPAVGS